MSIEQGDKHEDKVRAMKKAQIIELLPKYRFKVSKALDFIDIPRSTYYLWRKEDADFDAAIIELHERDLDDAEETMRLLRDGVRKLDKEGNMIGWDTKPHFGAALAFLEAKGKDRGWGRVIKVDGLDIDMTKSRTDDELLADIAELQKIAGLNESAK